MRRMLSALVLLAAACRDEGREPAQLGPSGAAPAPGPTASVSAESPPSASAVAASPALDSVRRKKHALRTCRHGALALKYVRDAYLASMKGKVPGPGAIPDFAVSMEESVRGDAPARPRTRRSFSTQFISAVRHCEWALDIAAAAEPSVDLVVREFVDLAIPLAIVLADAGAYYSEGNPAADAYAKGKVFHECLTASGACEASRTGFPTQTLTRGFEHLDAKWAKLAHAVDGFASKHPEEPAQLTEVDGLAEMVMRRATDVVVAIDAGADPRAIADKVGRLEQDLAALDAAQKRVGRPQSQRVNEGFVRRVKAVSDKLPAKAAPGDVVSLLLSYTRLSESLNKR